MALSREVVDRKLGLLMLVVVASGGCSSGIRLREAVISTPSHCPEIEVLESGDIELCHHHYAHWNGTELERGGKPVFVVNRGQITSGGHVVAKGDGDEITVFLAEGSSDKRIRIAPSGKVLDENGSSSQPSRLRRMGISRRSCSQH